MLAYDGYAYTSVTADNQEAVQGFQPFGPIANDDSALLLGFDDPGPFPALELNLAIVTRPDNSAPVAFQCGSARRARLRFRDAQMGILERQCLAAIEPAQGRNPRVYPFRSRVFENSEQEPAAGRHCA